MKILGVAYASFRRLRALPLAFALLAGLSLPLCAQNLSGFAKVASNARLELWVDGRRGIVAVTSLPDGTLWTTSPLEWNADTVAAGAVKMSLPSLLSIRYADHLGTLQVANSYASSLQHGGLTVTPEKDGVRLTSYFKREGFTIPVDFRLGPDSLDVSVPIKEITRDKVEPGSDLPTYDLNTLTLLPYFGAASTAEEGYLFVPDGSGAIIDFNNRRTDALFSQPVYGRDPSINVAMKRQKTEELSMPVFGTWREGKGGVLAVITSGESRAFINAETGWQRTSYNAASATFIYRDSDTVQVTDRFNARRDIRVLEKTPCALDSFSVSYFFLPPTANGYSAMADRYRRYLQETHQLTPSPFQAANPLYLDLFGTGMRHQPVLGIPVDVSIPYTTYADARQIIADFKATGVGDVVVRYEGCFAKGGRKQLPLSAPAERSLGGESGFRALLTWAAENNVQIYLDVDLLNVYRGGLGLIKETAGARSVLRAPVVLQDYWPSSFQKNDYFPSWFLLKPARIPDLFGRFLSSFRRYPAAGLSPSSMGSLLYSDFGATDRGQALDERKKELDDIATATKGLLFDNALAYAFRDAAHLTGAPSSSSLFDIEYAAVPFYEMVVRGSVPYALGSGNLYPDFDQWKLKLLETGADPSFTFVYRNAEKLLSTQFEYLSSVSYADWKDDAVAVWKELSPILETLRGQRLVDHRLLTRDVRISVFEGGTQVAVNYGTAAYRLPDGTVVAAGGYAVTKGPHQ